MKRSPPIPKEKVKIVALSWLPRARRLLFFLILLFSSTQLGLHFWPSSALVYGVRVDYLSPTLYFLDVLILIYLLVVKFENLRIWDLRFNQIITILLTNLIFSNNPLATLSWSLHFFLYAVFVASIKFENLTRLPRFAKHFGQGIWDLGFPLLLSSLFQLALAALQVYLGHSLQGPLYYLGERMVSVGQPGVALASFMDQVVLRAYGTFGHPNVLAGWLVIVTLIIHTLSKSRVAVSLCHCISVLGILLTQSRSAALAYFGIIVPFYVLKSLQFRALYFAIIFTLAIGHWSLVIPDRTNLSLTERRDLQQLSLQVIQKHSLFGTGANASISTYPEINPSFRLLQPDHNSFTLFLSWFGLTGVLGFLYLLRPQFANLRIYDWSFILPLIPLLLLDHYLLTSPQGLLILLIYFKVVHYSHAQSYRQ